MNAIKMAHDSETHQVNRRLAERIAAINAVEGVPVAVMPSEQQIQGAEL